MRLSRAAARRDIVIRAASDTAIVPYAADSVAQERSPRFSPDGKWLAYASDRTGQDEIYVDGFPTGGVRTQVSADGGREPVWSRDGSRVFYRAPDGWMMAAHVTRGTTVQVTRQERLFDASPYLTNQFLTCYDVATDGRFLMIKLDPQPERTDVVIIRNWVQHALARVAEAQR